MVKRKISRSKDSQNSISSAQNYSYRLLRYRARSEEEMKERLLRKGFNEDVVLKVISSLREKGLIDDRESAMSFLRTAISKNLGKTGVKEYLIRRRIPAEIVDEVIGTVNEDSQAEILTRKYLRKKDIKKIDIMTLKGLKNYLLRRGYGSDTIMYILKNVDTIMEER